MRFYARSEFFYVDSNRYWRHFNLVVNGFKLSRRLRDRELRGSSLVRAKVFSSGWPNCSLRTIPKPYFKGTLANSELNLSISGRSTNANYETLLMQICRRLELRTLDGQCKARPPSGAQWNAGRRQFIWYTGAAIAVQMWMATAFNWQLR